MLSFGTACPKGGTGEKYNVLKVPRGKRYQVILPDSTRVWLNADSRCVSRWPSGEKERRVFLEGEAYFDVKKAKDCPFIVETDRIDVEVLGTRFDVKAYSDEETVYTTLLTGSVRIVADGVRDRNVELKPLSNIAWTGNPDSRRWKKSILRCMWPGWTGCLFFGISVWKM